MLKTILKVLGVLVAVVLLLGVIAAVALPVLGRVFAGQTQVEPVIARTEAVVIGELIEIVSAPGQLEPSEEVQISARTSARIQELLVEEGDSVKAGDVLVRLDATDLQAVLRARKAQYASQEVDIAVNTARLDAVEAAIDADRARLEEAERDLNRKRALFESADISMAEVERAEAMFTQNSAQLRSAEKQLAADRASLEAQRFRLAVAQADIDRAEDELSYTVITTPIDGTVTQINGEVGEVVVVGTMNNAGTMILEVADLDEMEVVAQIDEQDVAEVKAGQTAEVFIDAYGDRTFNGTVRSVALAQTLGATGVSGGGKTFEARILIDTHGERLITDLTANVEVRTKVLDGVLKVPSQAVVGRVVDELPSGARDKPEVASDQLVTAVVYVVRDGKAFVTPVEVGASDLTHTVIEAGVAEGDVILTGPYTLLETVRDGDTLTMEDATPEASDDESEDGAS
ncbi:MAG: efflux RND transporter periplasmic adaptor subunit [Planctomycetota bacterium]